MQLTYALALLLVLTTETESPDALRDVTLELVSDKTTYYVGEPIRLSLTAKNVGTTPARGFFHGSHGRSEYRYGLVGTPLQRFAPLTWSERHPEAPEPRGGILPSQLQPDQEAKSETLLAIDPRTRSYVLDQPGTYQFLVINHPHVSDPSIEQRSNVVMVQVQEAPQGEREAFEAYRSNDLASVVQSASSYIRETARIKAVAAFLNSFPSSVYADAVRKAHMMILGERVSYGYATKEEQATFLRLKGLDGAR